MKSRKRILGLFFLTICLLISISANASAANKGYTISSGNTRVYSNTGLSKSYGTIYGSDEVTIHTITNSYTKVTYPVSKGKTKTGYIKSSALFTALSGYNYKAKSAVATYRRPGGSSYGSIYAGDVVLVLGKSGNYTQVRYPVSGGYKFAFVTNSDLNNKIIGTTTTQYANIANGTYVFTSAVKNGMVMDVYGNGNANGTNIQLYQNNNGGNQKFTVTSLGNGWYKILCAANGKSIDVTDGNSSSGANVQLYDYNGTYAQQWRFYSAGNGYYYIQNRLGNQLDVSNASSANETNIQVWEKNNTKAQQWALSKTTYTPPVQKTTYYVTTKAGLILRSRASTASSKLTVMPYGAAFTVSNVSGGWAYGTYGGKTGYASTQYLSTAKPSSGNSTSGKTSKSITVFSQTDSRWANVSYGKGSNGETATLSSSGCGILAYVNAVYYLNGQFISPQTLASWSVNHGYRINGVGTAFGLYKAFADANGSSYGFKYSGTVGNVKSARSHLQCGGVAVISVPGHLMALVDYDAGSGKYLILDSYKSSARGTYSGGYRWLTESQFTGKLAVNSVILLSRR